MINWTVRLKFLSTYPVRGTTGCVATLNHLLRVFLSTYPVRGTTLRERHDFCGRTISIHVPRAGYDAAQTDIVQRLTIFLSTYPVRGTTHSQTGGVDMSDISIHVPRAGYDQHKQKN